MHIVVVGAGEVGTYLADRLSREGHDVAMVERDPRRAAELAEQLDVHVTVGSGTHPSTLADAGISSAGLLVAVTNSDEANMLASALAKQAGVESTVARLESPELKGSKARQLRKALHVDVVIDPDAETAEEILALVSFRGVDELYTVGGGDVSIVGATIEADSPVAGRSLAEIGAEYEPHWEFLFGAITRGDQTIIPRGNQRLEVGDHVRILCREKARKDIFKLLGIEGARSRRVMILGGGRVGSIVAQRLEQRGTSVTLVERDPERARELAEQLSKTIVVQGEVNDTELLAEEDIGSMDAVVAATGEDDANVLACAFADQEGAAWKVAVLHGLSLRPLVKRMGIDVTLTPRTASVSAVLRFVRGGLTSVTTFLDSDAEVDEIEIAKGSLAEGAIIAELRLPKDFLIGAVVREGKAQIARGRTTLRAHDQIVVFARPEALIEARPVFA